MMGKELIYILGIESSCDDTSAAVIENDKILANVVANQEIHRQWGGVVPELASRAHQQNIIPVVNAALFNAKIRKEQLQAVAYTRGPGLLGPLLVGGSFAKGLAAGLGIPLIEVNHMQAHVLAHFIPKDGKVPQFPFLCLTVSGGHTQIVLVKSYFDMTVIGETTDDAAGEAFDKIASMFGFEYPGGPEIDKNAVHGDPARFSFPEPKAPGYHFSFSGLKTSVLYMIRDQLKTDAYFVQNNLADLCASIQHKIVTILLKKLGQAAKEYGIKDLALAGGVAANSYLRKKFFELEEEGYNTFIPDLSYCTDNAGMVAITGYLKFKQGIFSDNTLPSVARYQMNREK